jgi:hypothetical protein
MAGDAIATRPAHNFRSLRGRGITIPKIVLLHNDGDFHPTAAHHLGLIELPVKA